ncbi:MAG: transposase [Proteobacteria bacterium]|nr:transposase [Pseudomonadota bacterium]
MNTLKRIKFKGEIAHYLDQNQNLFHSTVDDAFKKLKTKTALCRANIRKKDGYHTFHLLFVLTMLPILKLSSVNQFCVKSWQCWSTSKKDSFYRFKNNKKFRWRAFLYCFNLQIFSEILLRNTPRKECSFIIDDTVIQKRGKKIANLSFIHDHAQGKSVLGYNIVTLALFNGKSVYPFDLVKKDIPRVLSKLLGDSRSDSGSRSFEAKYSTKLSLAKQMIKRAVSKGIVPGYILFDSWYSWSGFITKLRKIDHRIHIICRLKTSNEKYLFQEKSYSLVELYKRFKLQMKKDLKTGLLLTRVPVQLSQSGESVVIVFSKGYSEPELEQVPGKKMQKEPKWVAFLSTDTSIHNSTIIKKYIERWSIEVCFKECKQLLQFGKDQSTDFQSQICATTLSFLRNNLLTYLNEIENQQTLGGYFETLVDEAAPITYAHRLYDFFLGLFKTAFSTIFELFELNDEVHEYNNLLVAQLSAFTAFRGCET